MDLQLTGRRALVTGAGSDLGVAIAAGLAREGVDVALLGRDEERLERAARGVRDAGGSARMVTADLGAPDSMHDAVTRARAALGGPITVFVHAAAHRYAMGKVRALALDAAEEHLRVDLRGPLALLPPLIEDMMAERFGRILWIGSTAGRLGAGKSPLYAGVKAFYAGLIRNLAVDHGTFGVTANLVEPSFIATSRFDARTDDTTARLWANSTALRRIATAEEVADVVTFLCSPRAAYVTGATIPVTGGADLNTLW